MRVERSLTHLSSMNMMVKYTAVLVMANTLELKAMDLLAERLAWSVIMMVRLMPLLMIMAITMMMMITSLKKPMATEYSLLIL